MKRLSNLLAALVFASLVIFMSCGGGGSDPAPDPFAEAAVELTASDWSPSAVTSPDGNTLSDWSDFELSFNGNGEGGRYNTTGVPTGFEEVWPSQGDWEFGSDTETIERSDGTTITSTISANKLTLEFTFESSARTSGIDGQWTFVFGN